MSKNVAKVENDEDYCKRFVMSCKAEARSGKLNRMDLNKDNYEMYQMRYDFTHKRKGQSREVLAKTRNATEQIKSFFQQAVADLGDWYRITARSNNPDPMLIKPDEMRKLMDHMLGQADYFSHIGAGVQSGLLGSLSVSKVHGVMIPKPRFSVRKKGKGKNYQKHVVMTEDKSWELRFDVIRQEDWYPDPHGNKTFKLYNIEETEIDLHLVKQLAEGEDAIYDKEIVDELKPWAGEVDAEQSQNKANETGANTPTEALRPRVKLTEFWGTIVDQNTGDVLHENVVMTIANDEFVIRPPTENPLWHQKDPYVSAALIEVANSVWGVAMMDAGTKHNRSLIEIFNLMLDSAMKAVWGISQIRVDAVEDQSQIAGGVPWGTQIKTTSALPVGGKVIEEVVTGTIPNEVMAMFNLLNQETLTSMMTNDMRMGAQSMRAVKATEVVAAENSITSVFQGMAKNYEEKKVQPELELACWTICQNWDLIDKEVFVSLFGQKRGEELKTLDPQDVFVSTVNGMRFEVFGISLTIRRQSDFRKWTTMLQVISGSEVLTEAFLAKYSFEKLMGEIMNALDIDKMKIEQDAVPVAPEGGGQEQPPPPGPDMASQQASPANIPQQSALAEAFGAQQMSMPSSQAI